MILLSDQSKVIGSLQKTIDVLNATIKGLNDKMEKMQMQAVHENDEASNEASKCLGLGKTDTMEMQVVHENDKNNKDVDVIRINATTSSNDHLKPVHENAESPKCLGETSHNSNNSNSNSNSKNVKSNATNAMNATKLTVID